MGNIDQTLFAIPASTFFYATASSKPRPVLANSWICHRDKIFVSAIHQIARLQVQIFKNCLGRGSPSPLPRPLPPLNLGLCPQFGLRPQFSGASRPRFGLRPQFLPPPTSNSWLRHYVPTTI